MLIVLTLCAKNYVNRMPLSKAILNLSMILEGFYIAGKNGLESRFVLKNTKLGTISDHIIPIDHAKIYENRMPP